MLNRYVKGVCSVYGNDREATFRLATDVKNGGHYDSFVIIGETADSFCRKERYAALHQALPDATTVNIKGNMDADTAIKLYEENKRGKTCFAFTIFSPASLFMTHLIRHGVNIPEDCGVICFDIHTLLSDYLRLQLTTVDPRLDEMVKEVYNIALVLKEGGSPESKRIDAVICQGETALM